MFVHRCNVHGVSLKKIKRMLDTYEHNITGQSLFNMLPPLNCGRMQAQNTAVDTSIDSAQTQSEVPAVDDFPCCILSPSGAGTDLKSANSCVISSSGFTLPASGPHTVISSGYISTVDDGVNSCLLSESDTSNTFSEIVGSSYPSDIAAAAFSEILTLPSRVFENAPESFCSDSLGIDGSSTRIIKNASCPYSADTLLPVCTAPLSNSQDTVLLMEDSASSSKLTFTSGMATVIAPLSANTVVTTGVNWTGEKFTDNSAGVSGNICAEIMQTSGKLLRSEVSELISDSSPDDEAVGIVTEHVQSASEVTSSNTDNKLSIPLLAADTQLSDFTTNNADMPLVCSVPEIADYSSIAGSGGTESDDRCEHLLTDLSDSFSNLKSASGQVETLNGDMLIAANSNVEHLKHITLDKTGECVSSRVAMNEKNNKKYSEFILPPDAEETGVESEANCTDCSIDKDVTTQLLCENEKPPAAIEERPLHDIAGSVDIQTVAQCRESDKFVGTEAMMENLEVHSAQRVAELMYWGQADTSKRRNSPLDEAEVHSAVVDTVVSDLLVADSLAEQCVPGIEPKPQRTSLRSYQKKQVSSLMERIVAGQEWMNECDRSGNSITQSEHGLVDAAASHSDIDQCRMEQHFVSDEYQSISTQTEPRDFVTLTKATNGKEVIDMADYVAVVKTSPRVISLHMTDDQTSPNVPVRLMLHKSCSAADKSENVENSTQLELLASCFPTISSRDLQELLTNCGNDILIVADLLLEFGYEYNEPQEDIANMPALSSLLDSCSDCPRASPDHSISEKHSSPSNKQTKSGKRNTPALWRLYRDSLISKGIVAESVNMQPPCEFQFPNSLPTSGLYIILLHLLL